MVSREIPKLRVVLAFLIATFLFVTGFLLGYGFSYFKFQEITKQEEAIRFDLLSIDLQSEFLSSCDEEILNSISGELEEMGSFLGILEEKFGKTDPQVLEEKKKYTLLEVQHFLNMKKYKEICNKSIDTVLFFYSNLPINEDESERIGYILSTLKAKEQEKLMVYSFDFDLDTSMIKILRTVYNVTQENSVVINENKKLEGVDNIEDIEQYL